MCPTRWRLIEELYHSALELAPDQRAAFLDDACGSDAELRCEVDSLLRQTDSQEALVDRPAWEAAGELLEARTKHWCGHTVSHYRVLEKLGEGGMGIASPARPPGPAGSLRTSQGDSALARDGAASMGLRRARILGLARSRRDPPARAACDPLLSQQVRRGVSTCEVHFARQG